jgi:hypothetical protein
MNTNIDTSSWIEDATHKVMTKSKIISNVLADIEGIESDIRERISDAIADGEYDSKIDHLLRQLTSLCFLAGEASAELGEFIKSKSK